MTQRFRYILASASCTGLILCLAFFGAPFLFNSEWGELAVVSLLFTGAVLFLIAGLKTDEDEKD